MKNEFIDYIAYEVLLIRFWNWILLNDFFFSNLLGELYTWGKGRYGRLGHGDSEDQTKPKLVEALLGYRVIDVACGKYNKFIFYKLYTFYTGYKSLHD